LKKVYQKLARELRKYESHYMPEVIINVTKRTPWGFKRRFVKQPVRGI